MKKILYFVNGTPTEAELADAEAHYAIIRNGAAWHERDCFEECDLVMGKIENVPEPYRHLWQDISQTDAQEPVTPTAPRTRRSRQEMSQD